MTRLPRSLSRRQVNIDDPVGPDDRAVLTQIHVLAAVDERAADYAGGDQDRGKSPKRSIARSHASTITFLGRQGFDPVLTLRNPFLEVATRHANSL